MMRARFAAEARFELRAGIRYYSQAAKGLGAQFSKAVEEATGRTLAYPLAVTLSIETDIRRYQPSTTAELLAETHYLIHLHPQQ